MANKYISHSDGSVEFTDGVPDNQHPISVSPSRNPYVPTRERGWFSTGFADLSVPFFLVTCLIGFCEGLIMSIAAENSVMIAYLIIGTLAGAGYAALCRSHSEWSAGLYIGLAIIGIPLIVAIGTVALALLLAILLLSILLGGG